MNDIKPILKTEIIEHVASGLDRLKVLLKPESEYFNEVLILQRRLTDNENNRRINIINNDEYERVNNQITKAILKLIDVIDFAAAGRVDFQIKNLIRKLQIDKEAFGPLYLVNCDRYSLQKEYWKHFDEKMEESKLQFYFLPACPLQKPPSFAERTVWELILEELEEELDSLHYETKADSLRIKRANFKIGRNQQKTERAMKKYFCKRFKAGNFEQLLTHDLTNDRYEYVVTLFTLEIHEWKEFMPNFLQWMITTFSNLPENTPNFLFYVVVFMDEFVRKPKNEQQENIKDDVKDIIEKHSNYCTLLEGFEPVGNQDIERWFREVGEDRPFLVKEVVDALMNSLPATEKERYLAQKGIDMARMERLQQMVYEVAGE